MKTYILTSKIRIQEETIRKAKAWAKRRGYDYKKDIPHLVFDYITDGVSLVATSLVIDKE